MSYYLDRIRQLELERDDARRERDALRVELDSAHKSRRESHSRRYEAEETIRELADALEPLATGGTNPTVTMQQTERARAALAKVRP